MRFLLRDIAALLACCMGAACCVWFINGFKVGILIEPNPYIYWFEMFSVSGGFLVLVADAIFHGITYFGMDLE